MRLFDKNFLKFTLQFLALVFLGISLISYVSSLNLRGDVTAEVVDGR